MKRLPAAACLVLTAGLMVPVTTSIPAVATSAVAGVRAQARPAGATVDLEVQSELAAAGPRDLVNVIVVLRDQADVAAIREPSRPKRLERVVRTLQAKAQTTQKDILRHLGSKRGQVAQTVPLWIANAVEVTARPAVIRELATRGDVREIQPNRTLFAPASTTSAPPTANIAATKAPDLWDRGFRGQGVVVASMDTGVDLYHPDLTGRWRGGTNSWYDPNGQHRTTPTDVNGHGTWTMGAMVAGDASGTSIGMAPDATWIGVKLFNDRGVATTAGIHLGYQWLLDPDGNPATGDAPNVVDNSWTSSSPGSCSLEFQNDLRNLRAAGILPVFAAGNYGPSSGTSASPANNPEAFPVGAVDGSDVVDASSSRGPSACGQTVYPQLVAPGVGIRTTDLYGGYVDESGTSMAAPHVAGAVALLLSAFPGLSADRQQAALQNSAWDLGDPGPENTYGFGRLDTLAAYNWLLAMPDFTISSSPTSATAPPGGTASYLMSVGSTGGFAGDISLTLSGLSASQASWSFSPTAIVGGSGSSQLSITTASNLAPGSYPLTITATSGSVSHAASATLIVPAPPDFTVSVSPTSRSVAAGTGTSATVTVGSLNGFASGVSFSVAGLPPAVGSYAFSPAVVNGFGNSQLTLTTSATAPPGTYPLTISGTSGSTSHSSTFTFIVTNAPDFALSATPASISVRRSQSASFAISVSSVGGLTGNVSLSVVGLPGRATASWSNNPMAAPGSSTLVVRTTSTTPRGTFTLRLSGRSGSLVHQATVTLTVT